MSRNQELGQLTLLECLLGIDKEKTKDCLSDSINEMFIYDDIRCISRVSIG